MGYRYSRPSGLNAVLVKIELASLPPKGITIRLVEDKCKPTSNALARPAIGFIESLFRTSSTVAISVSFFRGACNEQEVQAGSD